MKTRSLRTRLLALVVIVIATGAAAQAAIAYLTALDEADEVFDAEMRRVAGFFAATANPGAIAFESGAEQPEYAVRVWHLPDTVIFDSRPGWGPERSAPARSGFSDITVGDAAFRCFVVRRGARAVEVVQGTASRKQFAGTLAGRFVMPILVLAPALILLVWWLVTMSFEPLRRTRREVASRAPDDLSPLPSLEVPDEVRPLTEEIDSLLGRVRDSIQARRSFIDNAAHELRTPLTALRLQLESLARADDPAGRELAVRRIDDGVARATRLVEQMLSLAREDDANAANPACESTDLADVVRAVVSGLQATAAAKGVDLGFRHLERARVGVPEESVAAVARNLLDNAVKYSPSNGRVDVAVAAGVAGASLVVEDSGPGIRPDELPRVFERFYRIAGSSSMIGSGLGLSIVETVARRHGLGLDFGRSGRLGGLKARVDFPREGTHG